MKSSYKYILELLLVGVFLMLSGCLSHKDKAAPTPPKLDGVNFGGVFVLEDWFFSSKKVGHEVSTQCRYKDTGIASSNIFTNNPQGKDFSWTSETSLIYQLLKKGYTESQVAKLFQQHRDSYLLQEKDGPKSLNENFTKLRSLGVKLVRLPITWAITYPDHSYTIHPGQGREPVTVPATNEVVLIQDPFYPQGKWASIPIGQIEEILKAANTHGIKILLEVHAYPGGSGDGTFNGVWPNPPRFWTTGLSSGNQPIYQKNFQVIFKNIITWAEGLYSLDDKSYANGLAGLSPMNEPAHLMGISAARCDQSSSWGIDSASQVLDTLALSVQDFQKSNLPSHNVKLYMNVIETMFDGEDPLKTIGHWWNKITTENERREWAVLDIHHYIAWDAEFNSCLDEHIEKNADGTYTINESGFDQVKKSTDWFVNLRQNLGASKGDLLSTSEFSASTNSDTWRSCASGVAKDDNGSSIAITNHKEYRNYFIDTELVAANSEHITTIFWTWMLPYNNNYKNEWALYSVCNNDDSPNFCGSVLPD